MGRVSLAVKFTLGFEYTVTVSDLELVPAAFDAVSVMIYVPGINRVVLYVAPLPLPPDVDVHTKLVGPPVLASTQVSINGEQPDLDESVKLATGCAKRILLPNKPIHKYVITSKSRFIKTPKSIVLFFYFIR